MDILVRNFGWVRQKIARLLLFYFLPSSQHDACAAATEPVEMKLSILVMVRHVPGKPTAYPEFSMFHELPAWGIYIRHAKEVEIKNLILSCERKDYRTAIVLDDVHRSQFITMKIKEPGSKKHSIKIVQVKTPFSSNENFPSLILLL